MKYLKKCLSIFLLIVCVFILSSCAKQVKADTAYVDWFGVRLDLKDENIIFNVVNSATAFSPKKSTLSQFISNYESNGKMYAVLRVKCVGDIRQRVYESAEHFACHYPSLNFENLSRKIYMDFPAEVLEVLEGDSSIVSVGTTIAIDMLEFRIEHSYYNAMITGGDFRDIYNTEYEGNVGISLLVPHGIDCTIPRIGYEYIVLVRYSAEENVYWTRMDLCACELTFPKDQVSFKKTFRLEEGLENKYLSDEKTDEEKMPDIYWEILERYDIKIK